MDKQMDLTAEIAKLKAMDFTKISWIYLNKDGAYANQLSKDRQNLIWIPSRNAAGIAKNTGLGQITDHDRSILVDYDKKLLGIYHIVSTMRADEEVKLKLWMDLKDKPITRPPGNNSGSYLFQQELINLLER